MSTIRCTTIQNLAGVEVYTAKAWVNFNGTGTVAIRAAGNVSSITDNGTGDYTVNFTTAMADANYNVVTSAGTFNTTNGTAHTLGVIQSSLSGTPSLMTTTQVRIGSCQGSVASFVDNAQMQVTIFR